MKSIADTADEQSTCCSIGGIQLVYNYFFDDYKKIVDRSRRKGKESKGVRWITSIDKDMVDLVKIFLDSGMQVRHLKNLIHLDFAVDNKNFNATIDKMEGGKLMESLLISNEPAYVTITILFLKNYGRMVLMLQRGLEILKQELTWSILKLFQAQQEHKKSI
jgi:hypothetical protein